MCGVPKVWQDLLDYLDDAGQTLPSEPTAIFLVVEEVPHTATGKLHRAALRFRYADHYQR